MTPDMVLAIVNDALKMTSMVSAPLILTSLGLGLLVALFQAMTQVNEASLSFVPKLVGAMLVLVLMGHWMLESMMQFTIQLYNSIPGLIGN